jgi:DNA-binding transcriptional regulator YdaS (Cro superfamily)
MTKIERAFRDKGLRNVDIARAVGVSLTLVRYWLIGHSPIAPHHAKSLRKAFDIPLHVMRPDIWDAPSKKTDCAA